MSDKPKRRSHAERIETSDRAMYKAAINLIARVGPHDMTMAMVGKKAGYSAGLVAYRFGSKKGLLIAVTERIIELWSTRVLSLRKVDGKISFFGEAEAYIDAVEKRTDLMRALFRLMQESYTACPEILPFFQEFDQLMRTTLTEAVKEGQKAGIYNKKLKPEAFSAAYIGVLRGIAIQHFINPKALDMKAMRKMVSDMIESQLHG